MSKSYIGLSSSPEKRDRKLVQWISPLVLSLMLGVGLASCSTFGDFGFFGQSSLRRALETQKTSPIVRNFYQARKFRRAWSGNASAEVMAEEARVVLAHAHEEGLNDDDYKTGYAAADGSSEDADAADIALTDAVLRYARDVRLGRVDPSGVYEDAGLAPQPFDTAGALNDALTKDRLAEFLVDLPPHHAAYRNLVKTLARYRAIADAGGWPQVPPDAKLDSQGPLYKRLASEDAELAKLAKPSAAAMRDAIRRFQTRYGLDADGFAGTKTVAVMNVPLSFRIGQIAANMERWRWLPRAFERRYVAVNVPAQSLTFFVAGKPRLSSKVVVGRKSSTTPIVRATIQAVVVNPPWNIPGDIAARDLLPRLKQNANYLQTRNMVVTDGPPDDPYGRTIDWKSIQPENFPYAIRQLPGPATALGQIMLDSPNDFDVYLHDTPNKKLFDLLDREISNGCVRVQQIFPLASFALTDDAQKGMDKLKAAVKNGKTQRLAVQEPLPVYFLYWTAIADDDGGVRFFPDLYGRDAPLIAQLTKTDQARLMEMGKDAMDDNAPVAGEADEISP